MCSSCEEIFPLPSRREFRRRMKHSTIRKMTAVQRIEINRFWNELEDIFDKLEEKKVDDEYSTLEEAENILNETAECDNEVEAALDNYVEEPHCDCKEDSFEEGYCSETEDDQDRDSSQDNFLSFKYEDDFLSYQHQKTLPLPPSFKQTRSIIELFSRNSQSYFL